MSVIIVKHAFKDVPDYFQYGTVQQPNSNRSSMEAERNNKTWIIHHMVVYMDSITWTCRI